MNKYYITMSKTKHLIVIGIAILMITGLTAATTPEGADIEDSEEQSEYDFPEADSITADAGTIHEAELSTEMPTDHWTGLFGTADGTLILGYDDGETNQVLYDWEAEGSVVYASEVDTPGWEELHAGDEGQIDASDLGDAVSDSYDNTFTENGDTFNSNVLDEEIEPLNTADTGEEGETEFVTYHLADEDGDGANSIFASDVTDNDRFDGTSDENGYEMILPTDYQDSSEYHLYVELE